MAEQVTSAKATAKTVRIPHVKHVCDRSYPW